MTHPNYAPYGSVPADAPAPPGTVPAPREAADDDPDARYESGSPSEDQADARSGSSRQGTEPSETEPSPAERSPVEPSLAERFDDSDAHPREPGGVAVTSHDEPGSDTAAVPYYGPGSSTATGTGTSAWAAAPWSAPSSDPKPDRDESPTAAAEPVWVDSPDDTDGRDAQQAATEVGDRSERDQSDAAPSADFSDFDDDALTDNDTETVGSGAAFQTLDGSHEPDAQPELGIVAAEEILADPDATPTEVATAEAVLANADDATLASDESRPETDDTLAAGGLDSAAIDTDRADDSAGTADPETAADTDGADTDGHGIDGAVAAGGVGAGAVAAGAVAAWSPATVVADSTRARPGEVPEARIAVWNDDETVIFRDRLTAATAQFVDDPGAAVTDAATVVSDAVEALAATLQRHHVDLDPRRATENPDTEALRVAIRAYRDFLNRILAV